MATFVRDREGNLRRIGFERREGGGYRQVVGGALTREEFRRDSVNRRTQETEDESFPEGGSSIAPDPVTGEERYQVTTYRTQQVPPLNRFSEAAATSPELVASSRRSPTEFITQDGGRVSATASGAGGSFFVRDVATPTQTTRTQRQMFDERVRASGLEGRTPPGPAELTLTSGGRLAGAGADRVQALRNPSPQGALQRTADFPLGVTQGFLEARERNPRLFLLDAATLPLAGAGRVGVSAATNLGVNALTRAAPAASLSITRRAGIVGGGLLLGGTALGVQQVARNPESFGATGINTAIILGGATSGFGRSATPRTQTLLGPSRVQVLRRGNTVDLTAVRSVETRTTTFGRTVTARGFESRSTTLRQTESGALVGDLTAVQRVRLPNQPRATVQRDSFLLTTTSERSTLGALRRSDNAVFAAETRPRGALLAGPGTIDPVFLTRGTVSRVNPRTGAPTNTEGFIGTGTRFNFQRPIRVDVATDTLALPGGRNLVLIASRVQRTGSPGSFTEVAVSPARTRSVPALQAAAARTALIRQGALRETRSLGRRGELRPQRLLRKPRSEVQTAQPRTALALAQIPIATPRSRLSTTSFLFANPGTRQRLDSQSALRSGQLQRQTGGQALLPVQLVGQTQSSSRILVPVQRIDNAIIPRQTQRTTPGTPTITPPLTPRESLPGFFPPALATLPAGGSSGAARGRGTSPRRGFRYEASLSALTAPRGRGRAPRETYGLFTRPRL